MAMNPLRCPGLPPAPSSAGPPADRPLPHVLVVDDSESARVMARRVLDREFDVSDVSSGSDALEAIAADPPDIVLLDLVMPGMSGLEVLATLRRTSTMPVIVLSGEAGESERVVAFDVGADDYIVKPFLLRELPARIRAVLRRSERGRPGFLVFGPLELRVGERSLFRGGSRIETTAREFDLLATLASAPRQVFSRAELLEAAWGPAAVEQDPATVTEHVRRLRHKVEDDPERPRWIQTVRGVGYRLVP